MCGLRPAVVSVGHTGWMTDDGGSDLPGSEPAANPYAAPPPGWQPPSAPPPDWQPQPPPYGAPPGWTPPPPPPPPYAAPPGWTPPPPPPSPYGAPPGWQPPPYAGPPAYGTPPGGYPAYGYPPAGYYQPQTTNGFSIAALICSIVLGWVPFLGGVLGVTFGLIGLRQCKRTGQRGRGLAIAGIVIGAVAIALWILFFALETATSSSTSPSGFGTVIL